jgi:hypothetical protein
VSELVSEPRCGECDCLLSDCRCFKPAGATSAGWERWIADFKAGRIQSEVRREQVSAFSASLAAQNAEVKGEAYPAPSVTSRDAVLQDAPPWPDPVRKLANESDRVGWRWKVAYAKGRMPHATTGRPGVERESWSVRFARGEWQGYAIYANKAWQSIMVTGRRLPPFGKLGRTELTTWLINPDQPASWYDEIRSKREQQAATAKERAASRPKKGTEGA